MDAGEQPRAAESTGAVPLEAEPERDDTEREAGGDAVSDAAESRVALFEAAEREEAEGRWRDIQTRFVDEPRASVEAANTLVSELVERLVAGFGAEQQRLEAQWDRGEDVGTEELRIVLQRYRSFFGRLLEL